jgi:hypothetical protein
MLPNSCIAGALQRIYILVRGRSGPKQPLAAEVYTTQVPLVRDRTLVSGYKCVIVGTLVGVTAMARESAEFIPLDRDTKSGLASRPHCDICVRAAPEYATPEAGTDSVPAGTLGQGATPSCCMIRSPNRCRRCTKLPGSSPPPAAHPGAPQPPARSLRA